MAALACGPRSTDLRHEFRATFRSIPAGLAQLVEHLTCNHEVASSILAPGSIVHRSPTTR